MISQIDIDDMREGELCSSDADKALECVDKLYIGNYSDSSRMWRDYLSLYIMMVNKQINQ